MGISGHIFVYKMSVGNGGRYICGFRSIFAEGYEDNEWKLYFSGEYKVVVGYKWFI